MIPARDLPKRGNHGLDRIARSIVRAGVLRLRMIALTSIARLPASTWLWKSRRIAWLADSFWCGLVVAGTVAILTARVDHAAVPLDMGTLCQAAQRVLEG